MLNNADAHFFNRGTPTIRERFFPTDFPAIKRELGSRRPDPLRDIRKMTDEDKRRATDTERVLVGSTGPQMRRATWPAEEIEREREPKAPRPAYVKNAERKTPKGVRNDPRPCAVCGKPKANHRGKINHQYEPMDDAAAASRAAWNTAQDEGAQKVHDEAFSAPPAALDDPKLFPTKRNKARAEDVDAKLAKVLELARRRDEIEEDLALVTAELKDLLA